MKLINILKTLVISLYLSLKRFPVAIALSTANSLILVYLNHNEQYLSTDVKDILGRTAMVLALGIPITLSIKLIFERKEGMILPLKAVVYALGAASLALYYFFLLQNFKMVPVSRYIALSLAFYLTFLFIPYFYRRNGFELYVIKLFTRFCTTVIYSIVLYLGIVAIIFTLDKLLGVPVTSKIYMDVWIVTAGIFAPSFFLAGVPGYMETMEVQDFPKLFRVLLLYIVMPIISIYTAILYIYFVKVIFTFQWPVGLVAHLVLWYSLISVVTIFFIAPLEEHNRWVRLFIFWLTKLILPLTIMMFFSVGIRVQAYGITENRYYVIILGLWAFCIMAYLSISKVRRNILLTVSLSILAILTVFGPWSSYSISKLSQNMRLENILTRNSMLQAGKVVEPAAEITKEDKQEITEVLKYFSSNHKLRDIRVLPGDFKLENTKDVFGFPYEEYSYSRHNQRYFSYNCDILDKAVDIQGYDYFLTVRNYSPTASTPDNRLEVRFDAAKYELRLLSQGKEVYKKSVQELGQQLHQKYGTADKHSLAPTEMTFVDENERVRTKIIFQNINGNIGVEDKELKINSMDFYLMVDLK